jgi:hypothetical protein
MDNPTDPHQFTRDAWEANADVWDRHMGDEGNDFFKMPAWPNLVVSSTRCPERLLYKD